MTSHFATRYGFERSQKCSFQCESVCSTNVLCCSLSAPDGTFAISATALTKSSVAAAGSEGREGAISKFPLDHSESTARKIEAVFFMSSEIPPTPARLQLIMQKIRRNGFLATAYAAASTP
jgi:hypothetical protein